MKIYLVEANYSDYEWSRKDLIGAFRTMSEAKNAEKLYLGKVEKLKATENPLTDEEQSIDVVDLPDDRYAAYEKYQNKINSVYHFDHTIISAVTIWKIDLTIKE